jgi:hypothetical protein
MNFWLNGRDVRVELGAHRPSELLTLAGYRAAHFTLLVEYQNSALEHIQDDAPMEIDESIARLYPVYRG